MNSANEIGDIAVKWKHSKIGSWNHINCCQAVLLAAKDVYGDGMELDQEQLMKIGSGFGGGMGNMQGTCGAVSGGVMALGLMNRTDKASKIYAAELLKRFTEKTGALICKDLKGIETGKMLCSCDDCVRNGAEILRDLVSENGLDD